MSYLPILLLVLVALFTGLFIGFFAGRISPSGSEVPPPPGPPLPEPGADVESLVRDGKLIEAIKLYRTQAGCGLREAKDAVIALQARIGK